MLKHYSRRGNFFSMKKLLLTLAAIALAIPFTSHATGNLIKGKSFESVYYVANDGKRYVFPNDKAYFTWYGDFNDVTTVSDAELASIQIGGNVTYKPGKKLVKIQTDPKVYAVDQGGVLRWVETEEIATALYGVDWAKQVDDIPDMFFVNYRVGSPVSSATDFTPNSYASLTIADDKAVTMKGADIQPEAQEPVVQPDQEDTVVEQPVSLIFNELPKQINIGFNYDGYRYEVSYTANKKIVSTSNTCKTTEISVGTVQNCTFEITDIDGLKASQNYGFTALGGTYQRLLVKSILSGNTLNSAKVFSKFDLYNLSDDKIKISALKLGFVYQGINPNLSKVQLVINGNAFEMAYADSLSLSQNIELNAGEKASIELDIFGISNTVPGGMIGATLSTINDKNLPISEGNVLSSSI